VRVHRRRAGGCGHRIRLGLIRLAEFDDRQRRVGGVDGAGEQWNAERLRHRERCSGCKRKRDSGGWIDKWQRQRKRNYDGEWHGDRER